MDLGLGCVRIQIDLKFTNSDSVTASGMMTRLPALV